MNHKDWVTQAIASIALASFLRFFYSLHLTGLNVIAAISFIVFVIDFAVGFVSVKNLQSAIAKGLGPLTICTVLYAVYSASIGMFGPGDSRVFLVALMYSPIGILGASLGAYTRTKLDVD